MVQNIPRAIADCKVCQSGAGQSTNTISPMPETFSVQWVRCKTYDSSLASSHMWVNLFAFKGDSNRTVSMSRQSCDRHNSLCDPFAAQNFAQTWFRTSLSTFFLLNRPALTFVNIHTKKECHWKRPLNQNYPQQPPRPHPGQPQRPQRPPCRQFMRSWRLISHDYLSGWPEW